MIKNGEYLRLKLDNLFIKKGKEEFLIPLSDISIIVIENLDCILTSRLLESCALNNVAVITCDYKHQPIGVYNGLNIHSRSSKIIKKQLEWSKYFKGICWKHIIESKIKNQRDVLILHNCDKQSINLLDSYLSNVEIGDVTNREGHAAKVYFNTLFGEDFGRNEEILINYALDYCYSIVRAYFTRLVVAYGFSGLIGLFHRSEYNNFNLADDLMEPFRPMVDNYIKNIVSDFEVFDLDFRIKLVEFLNTTIIYDSKKSSISSTMERYIHSFIQCSDNQDISNFIIPIFNPDE